MKDKHIHIAADSELLKLIHQEVNAKLVIDQQAAARFLGWKFAVYFSLTLLSYLALYSIDSAPLFVSCFICSGFCALLLAFNFAHDFSHNTVFKHKQWNNLGFIFIYTIVGAHAEAWKQRHVNSHHYAPNVKDYDSDLKISKLIRVIPGSDYHWYHRFQHLYAPLAYTTYSFFWVFIKDFVILFSGDEYTSIKGSRYHLSFWVQKLSYLTYMLLLPLLFAKQSWGVVLTGFVLMHLLMSLFLLFTFFMTHHVEATAYPVTDENGFITTSWLMNQVKSSNDFYPFSKTANFIFGGFNNHIAHHLFPHIHSIHYPALNIILYDVLIAHHIQPNQTTYIGGMISHLKWLRKMGQQEDRLGLA